MIFVYIVIALAVMCITCYIISNRQLQTLLQRVDLEYERMLPFFAKRVELLEQLLIRLDRQPKKDAELETVLAETQRLLLVLKSQTKERNEVISNNVILGNMLQEFYAVCRERGTLLGIDEQDATVNELACMEEDIAAAAEILNTAIRTHNVAIRLFPTSLVAKLRGDHEIPMYVCQRPQ